MIGRWLAKVVVVIAVLSVAVLELGSPVVTRLQLDGVAHDSADEAAHELRQSGSPEQARAKAQEVAAGRRAVLESFALDAQGAVHVIVGRQARSLFLGNWEPTRSWYDVKVSATGARGGT